MNFSQLNNVNRLIPVNFHQNKVVYLHLKGKLLGNINHSPSRKDDGTDSSKGAKEVQRYDLQGH